MSAPATVPMPETVFQFILAREGCDLRRGDTGYVDNPADPGGATNYGVTQGVYDAWRASMGWAAQPVRAMTEGEARTIYSDDYWRDGHCGEIAAIPRQRLALAHMDASVNHGLLPAARMLQRAVVTVVDGVIGPQTLAACAEADEAHAIGTYLRQRAALYRTIAERAPAQQQFLAGWLARLRWVARATGIAIDPSYAEV